MELASELKNALGPLAVSIDHIGSTSIPGLPAKDIIDIQITVEDISDVKIITQLVESGFKYRSDINSDSLIGFEGGSDELAKLYFNEIPGNRPSHIHIRNIGRINQQYPILFRDFLKADKIVRDAYAEVKKELAIRFPDDPESYYAIKDPYMDTIYRAACLWAEKTGWKTNV